MSVHEPAPGTRLGERFELRQVVAQTPAYVEYRAVDAEVGVEVGLWWIRPALFPDAARQEQLLAAAVELRRFAHPSVRKLHGVGRGGDGVWASWQLAAERGPAPMRGAPVELPSVVRWIHTMCGALAALHRVGLVHGRIVPADVAVVTGEWKLAGAGLWRAIDPVAAQAAWQRNLGFVAPEVRAGAEPTAATDVWSVAAIAAALIAGSDGADDAMRVVARRHPPLHDLFGGALAAAPSARPTDLAAFAAQAAERAAMPYLADDRTGPMRAIKTAAVPPAARPAHLPRGKQPSSRLGAGIVTAAPDEQTRLDGGAGMRSASAVMAAAPPPALDDDPALDGGAGAAAAAAPAAPARKEPESFALPTPTVAPPAPIAHPPAVAIRAASPPVAALDPQPAAAPAAAPPPATAPPAKLPRAITAPVGGFQMVSMKPKDERPAAPRPEPDEATTKKPKLKAISEGQKRDFATAPGALGYLAPPREVAEMMARQARARRLKMIAIALLLAAAAVGGFVIATRV